MKTYLLNPQECEARGFADFNDGPHLAVEIPEGLSTITCRTVSGKKVTIAFIDEECVDVAYHSGRTVMHNGKPAHVHDTVLLPPGTSQRVEGQMITAVLLK